MLQKLMRKLLRGRWSPFLLFFLFFLIFFLFFFLIFVFFVFFVLFVLLFILLFVLLLVGTECGVCVEVDAVFVAFDDVLLASLFLVDGHAHT